MTREGPTLAEQEMLHDGEPVFAMAWGGVETVQSVRRNPAGVTKENANRVFSHARAREGGQ